MAHAMPLDVMSAGLSPEEARKALDEAVHLFLVTAADMGTLEEILQESGYEFQRGGWVSPSWRPLKDALSLSDRRCYE
jgi:hypothetical protein